jgi:hypothetical protein
MKMRGSAAPAHPKGWAPMHNAPSANRVVAVIKPYTVSEGFLALWVLFLTQCGVNSSQIIWRKRGSFELREAATGDSKRSDLTDDQVLACGLDHCRGEMLELIDVEHSFHLGQQACN